MKRLKVLFATWVTVNIGCQPVFRLGYMTAIECAEEQGSEPSDTRAFASRHSNGFQQARYIRASKRSWTG
eukprot:m.136241 g.136241  ORF g.136241 m.136241 type:complete len:70 (+) comp16022_c2_seq18:1988-2197(+)